MAGEDLTYAGTNYATHQGQAGNGYANDPNAYNNVAYNREQGTQGYYEDDPTRPGQKRWVPGQSGAMHDINQYEGLAGRLYQREAAQADYGDYRYGAGTAQAGIGFQGDALGLQREAAMGNAPSQAEIAGRAAMDRASANQLAAAGSVRGGAMQQASAYRNAGRINAANQANMQQNIQAGRAAEMAQARAGYSAAAQGYTQSGLGYGQMGLGKSAQELQNEQFQRGLNQQGLQWGMGEARKTKENQAAQDLAAAQLNEGTYDAASRRATDKQNADTNERNGWLSLGGMFSDERTKKPAMLMVLSDASAKRGVAVEAIRKWAAADGDPERQRDIWDSYTGEGLSGGRKDPYSREAPAWLKKQERERRSGESDEKAANGRYAGDIVRENPYESGYREQPERLQSRASDYKYGEGRSYSSKKPEPNMSVDERQPTSQANDIMEGQRRQLAQPASVNVKQSVKATNPMMQQANDMLAGYQSAEARGPSVIDRGQDDLVYGSPSDKRTKNIYSDTNTKDIRKEGSNVGFEGGDVFKPKTYDESGSSTGGDETRPGVHDSAKPMGEVDDKMLSIEDATNGSGEYDESLKKKEFSDDKTKRAAIYRMGVQHGRNQGGALRESDALERQGWPEDDSGAGTDEEAAQAQATKQALARAQFRTRRVYTGAYGTEPGMHGRPSGSMGAPETGTSPGPKKLVTIQTAPKKDALSVQHSAYDAEKEAERAREAETRAAVEEDRRLAAARQGYRAVEGPAFPDQWTQPSDARTKEDAARKMEGTPYTYKDEYLPPEQKKGEVNVGPMAQNLEKNPITATTVKKDPGTGMRMLDMAKLVKVQSTEIAHLQEQIDDLRYGTKKKAQ